MDAATSPRVDPYPGLAAFQDRDEDRELFAGRSGEIDRLLALVLSERFTLLFGRSGLGKTSLIQAGIMERLRTRHFFPVIVRLTHDEKNGPIASILAVFRKEAAQSGVEIRGGESDGTLWEWFRSASFWKGDRHLKPIVILDQFEELFTRIRLVPESEATFVRQLADLVRGRPPAEVVAATLKQLETVAEGTPERDELIAILYGNVSPDAKVLVSIREDYLPELEGLKASIPSIFQHSLRLEPLTVKQASEAILKPTERADVVGETFTFSTEAVSQILTFLRTRQVGTKEIEGDTIEPVQLQILCAHLTAERRRRGASEITPEMLRGRRGMQDAISGHYQQVLSRFARLRLGWNMRRYRPNRANWVVMNRPRAAVAGLCERGLLTATGHRNSLPEVVIRQSYGVPQQDLNVLVGKRLLSVEARLGSQFYELIHDTLIAPLKRVGRRRLRNEGLIAAALVIGVVVLGPRAMKWYEHRHALAVITASASPSDLGAAFRRLIGAGYSDFTAAPLARLDASGIEKVEADFTNARLDEAHMDNTYLIDSDFTGASLVGADLRRARLARAIFTGADLTNVNLSDADLQDVDFTSATLIGTVFNGANVAGARFERAKVDQTSFTDVAWWLASGWEDQQLKILFELSSPRQLRETRAYRSERKDLSAAINEAPDAKTKADRLYRRARFFAMRNLEPDAAERDLSDALKIKTTDRRFKDALGYVLIQLGRCDDAVNVLRSAAASDGEIEYHLALALQCSNHADDAQAHLVRARTLNYTPTYERVLELTRAAQNR